MRPLALLGLCSGVLFALLSLNLACRRTAPAEPREEAPGPPWFEDFTREAGLDFRHDAGSTGTYFMPQIMGSGCALFDFDFDGRLGIYLLTNGGPGSRSTNKLFRQLPNGKFQDISAGSGLDIAGHNMGVAIADVNNDGLPDVLVTQYGGIKLFLNTGKGRFRDVTRESGLDNPFWGTSACFVDYDRDGWLDLVVVNYVDYDPTTPCGPAGGQRDYCHPSLFGGTVTRLFRNLGRTPGSPANTVRFQDVTAKAGLGRLPGPGLGVVCADFNGDGWPDIFVANDSKANRLWINQKDGTFVEEAVARGLAFNAMGNAEANMGVALGDVSGAGVFDLFVTHLSEETHTLWSQRPTGPRGFFRDRTVAAGLAGPRWRGTGFGTVLADFDHDGALDIAVANGRVSRGKAAAVPELAPFWRSYAERNQMFANDGKGHFRDISPQNKPFCGTPNVARGLACGDIDGDGALDLLLTTAAGPARIYRNVVPNRGHWLMVRARLEKEWGARDAYGAEITVTAGRRRWTRLVNPGSSYLSSNDPRAHFGLGDVKRVDAIDVLWPDGTREAFAGRPVDQVVELRKGQGDKVK
jgi:enediyne biosynthesis protein E4